MGLKGFACKLFHLFIYAFILSKVVGMCCAALSSEYLPERSREKGSEIECAGVGQAVGEWLSDQCEISVRSV